MSYFRILEGVRGTGLDDELMKTKGTGMKNKILQFNLILLAVVFTVASPHLSLAGEYYVSTTGSASNPGTLAQPWTLAKANTALVAGDTVYLLAGTYSTYINPSNSGTPSNRITYRNYGTDVITISGATYAIYLNARNYITVQGIQATNCPRFLYILGGAHHNIIAYCSFDQQSSPDWSVSVIYQSSQYNWIHHCQFSKGGECTAGGSDDGSVLDIGNESSATDQTWYNLFENNVFFHGGHHVVGLESGYNTFRNNYLHNEAWSRSRGNRSLYTNGMDAVAGRNIIEGNRFGYSDLSCDDESIGVAVLTSAYSLFRYNKIYHGGWYGLGIGSYGGYSPGSYNRVYNNTFFNNGRLVSGGSQDSAIWLTNSAGGTTPTGNIFKNNLYYSHYQVYGYDGVSSGNQIFANEFNGDVLGNPLFVNASTTPPADKTDSTLPNLDLQAGSPAINAGGALTTVATADTGSGTSLVLADARYFQDGTYAPAGTVSADWIAVGTVSNVVQISSINYSTNTITLANSISRNGNDPVWLFKKSDGVQVLYGSAPDAGAYEFQQTDGPPSAPRNLRIIP